ARDLALRRRRSGRQRALRGRHPVPPGRCRAPADPLMNPTFLGALGIAAMLALMTLRVPIGVAMGAVGFLGFAYMNGWDAALSMLGLVPYGTVATFTFSVLPLFVLMGHFATVAGLSEELYGTANQWFGHFRGGLAMATVVACGGFAAICGSSLATAAT